MASSTQTAALSHQQVIHRPTCTDIGHGQCEAKLPGRVAAFVTHRVDLGEAELVLGPLGRDVDGDLGHKERSKLGVAPPLQSPVDPLFG